MTNTTDPQLDPQLPPPPHDAGPTFLDDSEWEYEYHPRDKTSYHVSLDLTTHLHNADRRHPAPEVQEDRRTRLRHRRMLSPDLPAQTRASDSDDADAPGDDSSSPGETYADPEPTQSGPARRKHRIKRWIPAHAEPAHSSSSSPSDSPTDPETEPLDHEIQLLELHTEQPLLATGGRVFELEWASAVGTDLHFIVPTRRGDERSRLLGISSARLVARPLKLEYRAAVEEDVAVDVDELLGFKVGAGREREAHARPVKKTRYSLVQGVAGPSTPAQPQSEAHPASLAPPARSAFMQSFLATKRARHEHDEPPPPHPRSPSPHAPSNTQSPARPKRRFYMGAQSRAKTLGGRLGDNRRRNTLFGEYSRRFGVGARSEGVQGLLGEEWEREEVGKDGGQEREEGEEEEEDVFGEGDGTGEEDLPRAREEDVFEEWAGEGEGEDGLRDDTRAEGEEGDEVDARARSGSPDRVTGAALDEDAGEFLMSGAL